MERYQQNKQLQDAWVEFTAAFKPTFFVTLTDPTERNLTVMKSLLSKYCGRIDRALLGKKFEFLPAEERTDGIFFIEHVESNIHAHGLLRVPQVSEEALGALTKKQWHRVCRDGKCDVQAVYDCDGVARYCTKEMMRFQFNPDQIAFTRDFMKEIAN